MGVGHELKPFQGLPHAGDRRGVAQPVHGDERQEQIVERGQVREEIVGLKDGADRLAVPSQRLLVAGQRAAVEGHAAGHRHVEPGEDPQERRLAAAGRAHEHERLNLAGGECEPVEHRGGVEPLREVCDVKFHT